MSETDYQAVLQGALADEEAFVQMTLKGKLGGGMPWRQVTIRPVVIRGERHLQFSHFDARQDTTRNYKGEAAAARLTELLALPFHSITLKTALEEISVQFTRKGRAILHRSTPVKPHAVETAHDTWKDWPIPATVADPFLQHVGIQTSEGRVRAEMQDKFAQINEFLKLLDHTGALSEFDHSPLHLLDCGCGSAQLTFATYHYLNHIRGIPAELHGVDQNERLIAKSNDFAAALGLGEGCFRAGAIIAHQPEAPPDIVLALHACDTATDEALALGVRHGATVIMAVPCCHKHLHRQLEAHAPYEPVFRHGILKQRFGDILTDSFRALLLRVMGYKTEVVEFISAEHTARNLLIRAVKRTPPGDAAFVAEYAALKAAWGVTPYLETLLARNWRRWGKFC